MTRRPTKAVQLPAADDVFTELYEGKAPEAAPERVVEPQPMKTEEPVTAPAIGRPSWPARPRRVDDAEEGLVMPTPKGAPLRQQFTTKLPPELIARFDGFVKDYRAEKQEVVEQALNEYLSRRGYGAE